MQLQVNMGVPPAQVSQSASEDDIVAAFRKHGGALAGWKFLRRSNCAFIDFESPGGAAAARDALHGAEFGG